MLSTRPLEHSTRLDAGELALVYGHVAIDEQPVKACNERQTSIALPREPTVSVSNSPTVAPTNGGPHEPVG
jgi:hypothetical protein